MPETIYFRPREWDRLTRKFEDAYFWTLDPFIKKFTAPCQFMSARKQEDDK